MLQSLTDLLKDINSTWTLLLLATAYTLFQFHRYRQTALARLPKAPSSALILGALPEYYGPAGSNSTSAQWHRQLGPVVRFKGFAGRDVIQIGDTTAVAHIFSAGPYLYEKDTVEKQRFAVMFGAGLLSANGEMHRKLRKIMLPAFSTQQILPLAPTFEKCANDVRDRWTAQILDSGSGSAEIDLGMDCSFALLNAIGEAAFGYDFDVFVKGPTTPLFQALAYMDAISGARTYSQLLLESVVDSLPAWAVHVALALPIQSGRPLRDQLDVMQKVTKTLYTKGVEAAAMDTTPRKDLLSVLIKANLQTAKMNRLTEEEVCAQMMTFVNAGWGTVLSVLAGIMRQLAAHTSVQTKLRQELIALGEHPSPDQLQQAEYLDAVLKEAIRTVGISPLERVAAADDTIPLGNPLKLVDGSYIDRLSVKKGQLLTIPVQAMNLDTRVFGSDAADFKPSRWLGSEGQKLTRYNGYGPGAWNGLANFGAGTRACVGNKFAMLELRIFVHCFVTNFRFEQGSDEWRPVVSAL